MPTITPLLRTQKADRRGRRPVWLRLSASPPDAGRDRLARLGVGVYFLDIVNGRVALRG